MTHVDLQQAKDRLLELVELAASGEEVLISKEDVPLARLTSVTPPRKARRFGSAKGLIEIGEDFDEPLQDFEEYS